MKLYNITDKVGNTISTSTAEMTDGQYTVLSELLNQFFNLKVEIEPNERVAICYADNHELLCMAEMCVITGDYLLPNGGRVTEHSLKGLGFYVER